MKNEYSVKQEIENLLKLITFVESKSGWAIKYLNNFDVFNPANLKEFETKLTTIIYKLSHLVDRQNPVEKILFNEPNLLEVKFKWENFWIKENQEPSGEIVIRKDSKRRRARPDNFYFWSSEKKSANQTKDFFTLKHYASTIEPPYYILGSEHDVQDVAIGEMIGNNGVYWVFGDKLLTQSKDEVIRFYFNLLPIKEGILFLVQEIEKRFNDAQIPFEYKCRVSTIKYDRSDVGVLYLEKKHFYVASILINEIYLLGNKNNFFGSETPYFTKKIYNGLGFAEEPYTEESFGVNRSRFVAKALINNDVWKDKNKDKWVESIINNFEELGFDLNRIYCNPDSIFAYDFCLFNVNPLDSEEKVNIEAYGIYFKIARKLAFILCSEALWLTKEKCTWATVKLDQMDEIQFEVVDKVERLEIIFFLKCIYEYSGDKILKLTIDAALNDFEDKEKISNESYFDTYDRILKKPLTGINDYNKLFSSLNKTWLDQNNFGELPLKFASGIKPFSKKTYPTFTDKKVLKFWGFVFEGLLDSEKILGRTSSATQLTEDLIKSLVANPYGYFEAKSLGDDIIEKHLQTGLPLPNAYNNDEFCPTLTHGIVGYGYGYLRLLDPERFKKLNFS